MNDLEKAHELRALRWRKRIRDCALAVVATAFVWGFILLFASLWFLNQEPAL